VFNACASSFNGGGGVLCHSGGKLVWESSVLPITVLRKYEFCAMKISSMGISPSGIYISILLRGGGFMGDLIWVHLLTFKV